MAIIDVWSCALITLSSVQSYYLTSGCKSVLIIELLNTFSQDDEVHCRAEVGNIRLMPVCK